MLVPGNPGMPGFIKFSIKLAFRLKWKYKFNNTIFEMKQIM